MSDTKLKRSLDLNRNNHKSFIKLSYFAFFILVSLTFFYSFYFISYASAVISGFCAFLLLTNLVLCKHDKELEIHINFFLILILILPFLLHMIIFENGNSPVFWAILAPILSLILQHYSKSIIWFVSYMVMISSIFILDTNLFGSNTLSLLSTEEAFFQLNLIGILIIIFPLIFYFVQKIEDLTKTQIELINLEDKSQELINQLLPEEIAMRLKNENKYISDFFENVTVLFADMVGFTQLSSKITPVELVDLLNVIFSSLDQIIDDYGMEKIKTMGDAYMAASGIPTPRDDHAEIAAEVSLKFLEAVEKFSLMTGMDIKVRIGLHSGPVVAGVIGIKKTIYDLWGDTVNVASRMESHGIPDRIQVTKATYDLIREKYSFISRVYIDIKGKGPMETFILLNKKNHIEAKKSNDFIQNMSIKSNIQEKLLV